MNPGVICSAFAASKAACSSGASYPQIWFKDGANAVLCAWFVNNKISSSIVCKHGLIQSACSVLGVFLPANMDYQQNWQKDLSLTAYLAWFFDGGKVQSYN